MMMLFNKDDINVVDYSVNVYKELTKTVSLSLCLYVGPIIEHPIICYSYTPARSTVPEKPGLYIHYSTFPALGSSCIILLYNSRVS